MKLVHVAADPVDAEMIRGLLRSYGIEAVVRGELLHGLPGLAMMSHAAPSVWVLRDADEEQARAIVAEHHGPSADDESPWVCRICEEDNGGGFSNCWKCGAADRHPSASGNRGPGASDDPMA